jgi:hypothetical protein
VFKDLCVVEAWIPSLQKSISVKELTTKQQKTLLSSIVESASDLKPSFTKNLYQILLQNCLIPSNVVNAFTIIDLASIVVALRKQINSSVKVNFDKEDGSKTSELISLDDIATQFKNFIMPEPVKIQLSREAFDIIITSKIPTIEDDVIFFEFLPSAKKQTTDAENLKQLIAETYMYESAKCIASVEVAKNDLSYNTLTPKQKYALIEKMPASLIQDLLTQYAKWKDSLNQILTVKSSSGLSKVLETDSILFLTS